MTEEEGLSYVSMWEDIEVEERTGLRVPVIMPDTRIKLPKKWGLP